MEISDINKSFCKWLIDKIFASLVLLTFSPLFLLIALLTWLTSRGSALYIQERIGLNGKSFQLYKFRTMIVDADERTADLLAKNKVNYPVFKTRNDPRVTVFGKILRKTSLDELPQFINVLKGDMSVVGPRPHIQKEVDLYTQLQKRRLSVKPGITCIWQVTGRHNYTFDEWIELDLKYIDNWSCKIDVWLIIKTVKVIFEAKGY